MGGSRGSSKKKVAEVGNLSSEQGATSPNNEEVRAKDSYQYGHDDLLDQSDDEGDQSLTAVAAATSPVAASSPTSRPVRKASIHNPNLPLQNAGKRIWAPINIPMSRRRQTFGVLVWATQLWICVGLSIFFIRLPATNPLFWLYLAYVGWMLLLQNFHRTGGLRSQWVRGFTVWRWFAQYFPITLHKTVDLPADRSYVFGYHPHGIISIGAFAAFATEACDFSLKFPGINCRLLTLTSNFRIPFYSLMLTCFGICDAGRSSCNNILRRGKGNSIMLVLGGAKEALDARPGCFDLTLKHRKGFVKVALENHADLVPVFSFGENDLYDQLNNPRGSRLRELQNQLQSKLGFAIPLIKGRGVFNYAFGLLPHRRPVNICVGAPIQLPRLSKEEITGDIIDEFHERYMAELEALFNAHKVNFPNTKNAVLNFVDG